MDLVENIKFMVLISRSTTRFLNFYIVRYSRTTIVQNESVGSSLASSRQADENVLLGNGGDEDGGHEDGGDEDGDNDDGDPWNDVAFFAGLLGGIIAGYSWHERDPGNLCRYKVATKRSMEAKETEKALYRLLPLPSTDPDYRRVAGLLTRVLRANSDLAAVRECAWKLAVVRAPGISMASIDANGLITIFTGLTDETNDDQLMIILGHEVAHRVMQSEDLPSEFIVNAEKFFQTFLQLAIWIANCLLIYNYFSKLRPYSTVFVLRPDICRG